MAAALPIAALAGAGISALGTYEQGQASSNAASYQAAVAKNNAIIAERNAAHAEQAGEAQATATSLKGAAIGGKIKGAQAANNIDVNSGSARDVQVSEREKSQLDTETVLNNAELQAYGYRSQATGFQAQAGLETATAEQAPIGAELGAAGNLLSSASSIGAKWNGFGGGSLGAGGEGLAGGAATGSLY